MEQRLARKLAAILYADVAGYSRLTGEDEEGTHRTLRTYLDLVSLNIQSHAGRVVHYAGDAVLADFGTVVDALTCAAAIQRGLEECNSELPEERKVQFRIGVNLGDVIVDQEEIYGDGVNVAARLESLAEPGGICVSESVRTAVGNKLPLDYEPTGEQQVKNIREPVRAYRARLASGAELPAPASVSMASASEVPREGALELPSRPSIVVLAFENMSGDPEQEYFSDGVAEDIITDLSQISDLFVIARNSAFSYKGKQINVQAMCRELGVRYALEGSVRKAGGRVRITAQLVDGTTGGHVWAERYDRELTDIFALQDEVTREIVSALAPKLTSKEQQLLSQKDTDNLQAHDYLLRGREQLLRMTKEASAQARSMLERAVALDPQFSAAYSHLALNYVNSYINRWSESVDQSLEPAIELAQRAVALDESNPHAHFALGFAALWMRQHERALAEAEKTIGIAPNSPDGYQLLASIGIYTGTSREAIASLRKAMRLDPHYKDILLHLLAQAYFQLGQYENAVDALKRRLIRKPESDISRVLLAAAYGHLGNMEQSRAEWDEALRINPEYSLEHRQQVLPYKSSAEFEHVLDGLRKAGLQE